MVAAVVGGLLGAVTSNVAAVVFRLVGKSYDLWSDFDNDIRSIKSELLMIVGEMEDELSAEKVDMGAVASQHMKEMHDLALEIEDFLDRIHRNAVGWQVFEKLKLETEATEAKKLMERLKNAYQRKRDHNVVNGSQPTAAASSTPPLNTYTTKVGPVGIDESKKEICDWVTKDVEVEGQPEQLSVISIVGFSGSGKSTLAKAVYDSDDVIEKFPHRACVVASKHGGNIKGLLTELLVKLGQRDQISDSGDVEQLKAKISKYLKNTKRYLIVLDDIKDQRWWDSIKSAFPEKATGRIIVTTTIHAIARVCSRVNGYVHNMAALDCQHSIKLMKHVLGDLPGLEQSSKSILNKCEGHPHALVTMANYLQSESEITETNCQKLCQNLGLYMQQKDALKDLQKVLMNSYRSLPKGCPEVNLKTCLLYLSVFPNGSNIRGSRLMRRWMAEGYLQKNSTPIALESAADNLKELVNHSAIWPIDTNKNANVKTCRAHGVFHEFLLHISKFAKYITSLDIDNEERRDCRHLFIQNGSSGMTSDDEEKLRAHSLTMCESAGKAVGYFALCPLLRVLDLEECSDLEDEHLDGIHELWHLKYLSVGDNISRLPKDIEKLHFLETLDMRKTKKDISLPVEILKMPHIAHLLGRFKLDDKLDWDKSKPEQYLPAKSNLQTIAGFVTDHNPGFQMLMVHMKQLRKVKVWAMWRNSTGEDPDLERSINNFVQAEQDTAAAVRSLSLYIGNSSGKILRSLAFGFLKSLKLHGKMSGLVHFATELYSLKELCLSSTNDLTRDDLSRLRDLIDLEYLKLVGISLGGFVIASEDFPGLLHLYLVQCPSLPTIEEGSLPNLLSLRLLNQCLDGLSGIKIKWHKFLQEVALDTKVNPETKKEWHNAAKKHPKRPKVLFFRRVTIDPDETRSMVKYVATKRTPPEMDSSNVRRKRKNQAVQPDSSMDIDSDFKRMKVSGASATSTEVPTSRDDSMSSSSSADPESGDSILHKGKHHVLRSF